LRVLREKQREIVFFEGGVPSPLPAVKGIILRQIVMIIPVISLDIFSTAVSYSGEFPQKI